MTTVEFGTVAVYEAMADLLNNDPAWADKGKAINYSMIFDYGPPVEKAFFVRFADGKVFDVKELTAADTEKADFVLSAAPDVWRGIFDQTINPTNALVKGQIKVKGKIGALLRHMTAFSYIIDAMTKIELR
ncbi:MAG TPA: SCP2 sterol-binding domain-containing protein [Acidimicrobiia bacterium]|nr:SCP2 sterol-binding domain-containing protein [Acidimicrobiia bacterium]